MKNISIFLAAALFCLTGCRTLKYSLTSDIVKASEGPKLTLTVLETKDLSVQPQYNSSPLCNDCVIHSNAAYSHNNKILYNGKISLEFSRMMSEHLMASGIRFGTNKFFVEPTIKEFNSLIEFNQQAEKISADASQAGLLGAIAGVAQTKKINLKKELYLIINYRLYDKDKKLVFEKDFQTAESEEIPFNGPRSAIAVMNLAVKKNVNEFIKYINQNLKL